jgi:hypothetical protein
MIRMKVAGTGMVAANGKTYSGTLGQILNVPDEDAGILEANGWEKLPPLNQVSTKPTVSSFAPMKPKGDLK